MKILLVGILSAASIAHTGCGETAPPPQLATDRPQQLAPADPVALRDSSKAAPVAQELPNIPEGAEWTIYCATISGPRHLARSKQLKIDLIKSTGLND